MKFVNFFKRGLVVVAMLSVAACETVQTTQPGAVGIEREQRFAVPAEAIEQAAGEQYAAVIAEAREKGILNRNPAQVERVRSIVRRLIPATEQFRPDARDWNWEANVFSLPEINAWVMPGGKIGVNTALIEKLNLTDAELAAVLGHEIAHALREHARERVSQQTIASGAIAIGSALFGLGEAGQRGAELAYQGFVGLPKSREQEVEADRIGVELAARAGYDPYAAVSLWEKMAAAGDTEPPKFLSTHPPREERLRDLAAYAERVAPLYKGTR